MFNKEKAAYDLALIYATAKLEDALHKDLFKDTLCPVEISQAEYLLDNFKEAFDSYIYEPIERFTDVN